MAWCRDGDGGLDGKDGLVKEGPRDPWFCDAPSQYGLADRDGDERVPRKESLKERCATT
jgi:hypothetical protein